MPEIETPPVDDAEGTTTTDQAEGTTLDLENLPDARISDVPGFKAAMATLLEKGRNAVRETNRFTGAVKGFAEARVAIRPFFIRENGFPDWGADTNAYAMAVNQAESLVLASLGTAAKKSLTDAVRQHVRRTYMLRGIVGYVLRNGGGNAKLATDAEVWGDGTDESAIEKVLASPSETLIREVRKHYASANLTIPDGTPFTVPHETPAPGGGNPPSDPPSVLKALRDGLGGLNQILPAFSTLGILETLTAISVKLLAGKLSEVKDRPRVIDHLHRIAAIAEGTAKQLDGKGTEEDEKTVVAAYFNAEDDKID